MKLSTAAALAGLIASASAHATFQYIWTDPSTSTNTCVRTPPNNNPVGTLDADLSCNANGAVPAAAKCAVAAGQEIGVEMHQQPGDRTCTTEAIGGNHDGPVIIYMAKVADSGAAFDPSTASWFKIVQEGLITADATTQTYYWATDDLNDNCGKFFFKIPSDIAPGDYMLRAEVIALHVAGSLGGAQHYMSCYQLTVTGGGSASPAGVKFPGAYSETDPGILFNIYTSFTTYTIPGPTVYGTGSRLPVPSGTVGGTTTTTKTSSTSTTTTTTKTATTTTTTSSTKTPTTTTTTTTTTKTTTTTANGATQTLYGQCGGTGYTGPTTCPSGAKCNTQNAYYSQCIPA